MFGTGHETAKEAMTIRVAILGRGRMGQALECCIAESNDLDLAGIWVRKLAAGEGGSQSILSDDISSVLSSAQVAIDFTLPTVTESIIRAVKEATIPLVCGVSGLTPSVLQLIREAAADIPILHDRNMSLGVAVLQRMVQLAGAALGDDFSAEIHETHHVHKIDAPSGTALQLGEALAASRKQAFVDVYHFDPGGNTRPTKSQIHYEVTRQGEVPGNHTVLFKGAHESLSLLHRVDDRRVFAVGAIKAARWLIGRQPGLYGMQDLI